MTAEVRKRNILAIKLGRGEREAIVLRGPAHPAIMARRRKSLYVQRSGTTCPKSCGRSQKT